MNPRRLVILERASEFNELIAEHGTRGQAQFVLRARGTDLAEIERRHTEAAAARAKVIAAAPQGWKVAPLLREDLDRFLFRETDVVVALGQDGLVANLAAYLTGQPVIGVNNAPDLVPGVLASHEPPAVADLLADTAADRATVQARTMVEGRIEDGQRCVGLNEVFFGHATHQSAKYEIEAAGITEFQSSSGLIVATGTGGTGWAASLNLERGQPLTLPDPLERRLAWFVREPWPSRFTGSTLVYGELTDDPLGVTCRLGAGAVVFSDGIENDALIVSYGQHVDFAVAPDTLNTVV